MAVNQGGYTPFSLDSAGGGIMNPSSPQFQTPFSGTQDASKFGLNAESFQMVGQGLGAFSSLANIYAGFKAMKLAKDQFKFQKDAFNKNFAATAKDYTNTLKDKWQATAASNAARGRNFQSMDSYVGPRQIDATPI